MTVYQNSRFDDRHAFYQTLAPASLAPLWEVMKDLVPHEPCNRAAVHSWRYSDVRALLMQSGRLVTAEQAERRVLVFENPNLVGQSRINATLYAGMQLILPGETAPAHKHTAAAIRFVLESDGGYTTVDGEKCPMSRGDVVITPSGAFHEHGHDGAGPVIWIDGLDVPLVNFFECGFSAELSSVRQELTKAPGHAESTYGSGLLPLESKSPFGATSPVFSYPYQRSRAALIGSSRSRAPDPHHGYALRYANPLNGGWVTPTIAAWLTYLPGHRSTKAYRSTDNQVAVVAEGEVIVHVEDQRHRVGENDVIALPGWTWRRIEASSDAMLFFFSDRSAQEKLGIWKEELGL